MGHVVNFDINRVLVTIACLLAGVAALLLSWRMWNQKDKICQSDDDDCHSYNQGLVTFGVIAGLIASTLAGVKSYYKFWPSSPPQDAPVTATS